MSVLRSLRTIPTIATAALGVLLLSACGESAAPSASSPENAGGDGTIVFAAVPSEESASLQTQYDAIIKLVEKETGKKIEFQNATDYAAVIEGQRAGKIDLAAYGPFSYKIAKDGGVPVEPISSLIDEAGGQPGYYSMGWVKADSPIADIKEFKGKRVCFVDKASTSGYLYPSAGLLAAGINPGSDVQEVLAGGHDASILAILSGQCDAGFAYDKMPKQMIEKGQLKDGDVKQVWQSEQIAGSPIAMNTTTLDPETQNALKTALNEKGNKPALVAEGICTTEDDCVLPEDASWGYVAVQDSDYDGVRKVCDLTKAEACNQA